MTIPKKPKWPYAKETILTAAPNGQWCKKHRGRVYYFGVWNDPKTALDRWRSMWPGIVVNQSKPASEAASECSLEVGITNYLMARLAEHRQGDIEWVTYRELNDIGKRIVRTIGGDRSISGLVPMDFDRLNVAISHLSPMSRQKFVQRARTIFEWIEKHIGLAVNMGGNFNAPPRKVIRRQMNQRDSKIFTPAQIHRLLELANPQMKAMMMLGINGGYGNRDTSELPADVVDLDGAMIDYHRHKTEARRVVPLWPETVAALRAVVVPGQDRFFLDRFGKLVERRGVYGICRAMQQVSEAAGIPFTFYWFRYTFATIASEIADDHARKLIMGHVIDGVSENYVLKFPVERLRKLTDHVHAWLYTRMSGSN